MINLIPPKGHTALKHEYILRVGAVYGFLLAGVLGAGAILMMPTYVLVSSQLTSVRPDEAQMSATKQTYSDARVTVQQANAVMAQLRNAIPNIEMSDVIEEVVRVAPEGVVLSTFQAEREGKDLKKINIQGKAATRKTLAALKSSLEASSLFATAEVPISDLARENNLPFVVTVTLKESVTPQ